jgi:hypothetical protein
MISSATRHILIAGCCLLQQRKIIILYKTNGITIKGGNMMTIIAAALREKRL